jgi:Kef-type K+ transport system membrane component KefB
VDPMSNSSFQWPPKYISPGRTALLSRWATRIYWSLLGVNIFVWLISLVAQALSPGGSVDVLPEVLALALVLLMLTTFWRWFLWSLSRRTVEE